MRGIEDDGLKSLLLVKLAQKVEFLSFLKGSGPDHSFNKYFCCSRLMGYRHGQHKVSSSKG